MSTSTRMSIGDPVYSSSTMRRCLWSEKGRGASVGERARVRKELRRRTKGAHERKAIGFEREPSHMHRNAVCWTKAREGRRQGGRRHWIVEYAACARHTSPPAMKIRNPAFTVELMAA